MRKNLKKHIKELEKGCLLSRLAVLAVTASILLTAGHFCLRTIGTGLSLFIISDNILYIEEAADSPYGWNDDLSQRYKTQIEARNELINSEDHFVSFLATANSLMRLIVSLVLMTLTSLFAFITYGLASVEIKICKQYIEYKRRHRS